MVLPRRDYWPWSSKLLAEPRISCRDFVQLYSPPFPLYLASRPKRVLEGLEHELEPPPRGHPFCQLPVDSSLVRIDYQDITKGARERTPHFLQL